MSWTIHTGDCVEWAAGYDGPKFHALLADPPYHLLSDTRGGSQRQPGTGPYGRHALGTKGFMGKEWDGGGVAFDPATWAALAEHLHPGAFMLVFASSRGWHRLAVALEDSGLVAHPSVFMLGWSFGQGFPKATRVHGAAAFDGHRYGRQALKPALEPILCFQKPYAGRAVDSITATGAGALNIDGGRLATGDNLAGGGAPPLRFHGANHRPFHDRAPRGRDGEESAERRYASRGATDFAATPGPRGGGDAGRWPANLTLTHTADCGDVCAPGCPVAELDAQAGPSKSGANPTRRGADKFGRVFQRFAGQKECVAARGEDSGPVSRFFHRADWSAEIEERIAGVLPVRYESKVDRGEREAGVYGDRSPLNWSSGEQSPGTFQASGTERNVRNSHPTLKPIALTRWLASLLLPPSAYAPRRILVPFAGAGSEMIGAGLAGWEEIVGVEGEAEHVAIAEQRLRHWLRQPSLFATETTEATT